MRKAGAIPSHCVVGALFCGAFLFPSTRGVAGGLEEAEQLFAQHCAVCHGADRAGYIGPALNKDTLRRFSEF